VGRLAPLIAAGFAVVLAGCSEPPFGETLVVVDTDVSVPRFVSRLRIDLFTADGRWYDSRDVAALRPADWPVSFSVVTDTRPGGVVRLRLRAYPEGAIRDYRGMGRLRGRPFVPPTVATSLAELCAAAPTLPKGAELTARRGAAPITRTLVTAECPARNLSGSIAAHVDIPTAGRYWFEVARAIPDGANGIIGGDATLVLRRDCVDERSQLACADDPDLPNGRFLPRLELDLAPGRYTIVTGGKAVDSPADLTLRWGAVGDPPPSAPPRMGEPDPGGPALIIDGVDLTPPEEPVPGLAIDRMADVEVRYGARRTAPILLRGECLGTQAILDAPEGALTCIDSPGVLEPVPTVPLLGGIDRTGGTGGPSRAGTWAREAPRACPRTPRAGSIASDGTPLDDEEVCVPGGAVVLGSRTWNGVGRDTIPQQVAVVAPFLMDKYELTVARFRQALRDGFAPRAEEGLRNDGALFGPADVGGCTFSGDERGPAPGVDRERYPMTCIGWENARALCRFLGGDLPTSAEWELAARAAGRAVESDYPWGDAPPASCDDAVFSCPGSGRPRGPRPVGELPAAARDVTPLGIVGMGGNVSEWTLDSGRPYADACWWQRALDGVGCDEPEAPQRMQRGGNWSEPALGLLSAVFTPQAVSYGTGIFGLRCVRRAPP
jgi:formylglycine-generating enzyme required for sulfatase activity